LGDFIGNEESALARQRKVRDTEPLSLLSRNVKNVRSSAISFRDGFI
jgi:hypothetical protein